jgi:hypothetical protein
LRGFCKTLPSLLFELGNGIASEGLLIGLERVDRERGEGFVAGDRHRRAFVAAGIEEILGRGMARAVEGKAGANNFVGFKLADQREKPGAEAGDQ